MTHRRVIASQTAEGAAEELHTLSDKFNQILVQVCNRDTIMGRESEQKAAKAIGRFSSLNSRLGEADGSDSPGILTGEVPQRPHYFINSHNALVA